MVFALSVRSLFRFVCLSYTLPLPTNKATQRNGIQFSSSSCNYMVLPLLKIRYALFCSLCYVLLSWDSLCFGFYSTLACVCVPIHMYTYQIFYTSTCIFWIYTNCEYCVTLNVFVRALMLCDFFKIDPEKCKKVTVTFLFIYYPHNIYAHKTRRGQTYRARLM